MKIEFRECDSHPGVWLFRCERLKANLTVSACVRNHTFAPNDSCGKCEIGAANVAASTTQTIPPTTWDGRPTAPWKENKGCVRCNRTGSEPNSRLISRMRLVRDKTVCVSCYNREREVQTGMNSKGDAPKKWAHLRIATVQIRMLSGKLLKQNIGFCSGRPEAERVIARRWPGSVLIDYASETARSAEKEFSSSILLAAYFGERDQPFRRKVITRYGRS